MKKSTNIATAALSAVAVIAAFGVGSASATTLELGGKTQNNSVEINARVETYQSTIIKDTFGFSSNTCAESRLRGATESPYSGSTVTASLWSMTFGSCQREPVTVHFPGTMHLAHISGTTNGTVTLSGSQFTTGSPFGTLTCSTGAGTHIGTLTGTGGGISSFSTLHVNATLTCSGISSKWEGTYVTTWAEGLGVSA